MSVLTRLLGWLLLAGLALGTVLRLALGRRRFPLLLALFLALPASLHVGYVMVHAIGHAAPAGAALLFLLAAVAVFLAGGWLARRWLERRPLLAALAPAATGIVYAALPFTLYSWYLRSQAIDLDVLPTALFLGTCLFASALLLPFAPGGGRGRGAWPGWLRRR